MDHLINCRSLLLLFAAASIFISCNRSESLNPDFIPESQPVELVLWYDQPAVEWTEALPVGNGRLGAMVFGRTGLERIQINEESLWGGSRVNNNNPGALEHLPEIRDLILDGKIVEAKELADQHLLGTPFKQNSYRTLGDLFIDFGIDSTSVQNYRRELNLREGVARVKFDTPDGSFHYELFSSAPDNAIVLRLTTTQESGFDSVEISQARAQNATVSAFENGLELTGQVIDEEQDGHGPAGDHMRFASKLTVSEYDGSITQKDTSIVLNGGQSATLLFTAATDYDLSAMDFDRSVEPLEVSSQILSAVAGKSYDELKEDHTEDHRPMMDRVVMDLGGHGMNDLPTDQRLERFQAGEEDPALLSLYFQYGRYLLMGSSRAPGVLPANLQGIWNKDIWAPWGSDYHVNINIQMNYWPANVTNLDETVPPLVNFMSAISKPGEITARDMYGANGWAMHHTTDVFGKTGVMDGIHWGMFPLGGAWMMFPLQRHFEFTQDTTYYVEEIYPLMRGSAEFILDFLVEDDRGRLVTVPSYSPENSYILPGTDKEYKLTYGPTMDIQIIRELFGYIRSVTDITGEDDEFLTRLDEALERMPEVQIGDNGTIMEWIEDYEEAEPGHRHISHLLGLHPGTQITEDSPGMFEAAKRTIERRLEFGGGHTGWSRAWIINFYARLLDADAAYKHLRLLLEQSTLPNLFDTHPPFQIDGNFGGTAGIAEMLLQSHQDYIQLLPALPDEWDEGSISGLKARGNFEVDMTWSDGGLDRVRVRSLSGGTLNLEYSDERTEIDTAAGESFLFDGSLTPL